MTLEHSFFKDTVWWNGKEAWRFSAADEVRQLPQEKALMWLIDTRDELGSGVSDLLASLGHTGKRRVVLGHILNTQTLMKTDEQKKKGFV